MAGTVAALRAIAIGHGGPRLGFDAEAAAASALRC